MGGNYGLTLGVGVQKALFQGAVAWEINHRLAHEGLGQWSLSKTMSVEKDLVQFVEWETLEQTVLLYTHCEYMHIYITSYGNVHF